MLKLPAIPKNKVNYFIKTIVSYLHNIEVPNNTYLTKNDIKKDKNGNFYLLLNKHNFFIGNLASHEKPTSALNLHMINR